jgi:hypothetical protein
MVNDLTNCLVGIKSKQYKTLNFRRSVLSQINKKRCPRSCIGDYPISIGK